MAIVFRMKYLVDMYVTYVKILVLVKSPRCVVGLLPNSIVFVKTEGGRGVEGAVNGQM